MVTIHDMLKTDPFRCLEGDPFYIKKDVFYDAVNGVYAYPEQPFIENIETATKKGNSVIKIFHINGYAGCGKTLLAHFVMYKYGYDNCFYYEFDQGEGKDYSLEYVRERMIRQFAEYIVKVTCKNNNVLLEFSKIGRNFFGEGPVFDMLSQLFFDTSWTSQNNNIFDNDNYTTIVEIIVNSLNEISKADENVNTSIEFLLFCDYFWRCAEYINKEYKDSNTITFCLLDNLDNLQRDAVVDLYIDIHNVVQKLYEHRVANKNSNNFKTAFIKYIFLFPTREVTNQRLTEGLRRRNKDNLLSRHGTVFHFDMENNCATLDEIIKNRKKYWSSTFVSQEDVEKLDIIEKLMKIPYVQGNFSALLNGNYAFCVDRILDLYEKNFDEMQECFDMQADDKYGSDYLNCSKEGTRGALLRMLLELFKEKNVYDSVTDLDEDNEFNFNGKLGLTELNCVSLDGEYSVSTSRILLTFIRESNHQRIRINHLFRCFSDIDGKEICRYLYALSENIRDTWRRLLVFSSNIPNSLEELYEQYNKFSNNNFLHSSNFSEVELCLSGNTYVRTVVPHFEFYLSRINMKGDICEYPPLFTKKSINLFRDERPCMRSIEKVVSSVENCASEIYKFDTETIKRCIKEKNLNYVERFFVSSKSNSNAKQSHLSRIIFSHISYIERFRRYILYKLNEGKENAFSEEIININKQLISYIIRYLMLFDSEPFFKSYKHLLSNDFLPVDYDKDILEKKTCKDIVDLIQNQYIFKSNKSISSIIELGFENQKNAQLDLLSKIENIHESEFKRISKIEL